MLNNEMPRDDEPKMRHLARRCDRRMSVTSFQLACLRDSRIAPLATSALPAWLWSTDATHILWANPVGAAMLGASTSPAIGERTFDGTHPASAEIARLAATLTSGAAPRLERLRGFGAGVGRSLTCACSLIDLTDNTAAILVAAAERAGPSLSLDERLRRLLADSREPVAAFSAEGELMHATQGAQAYLRGATSLPAIGGEALATEALASGHAAGRLDSAPEGQLEVSIDRLGGKGTIALIASFSTPIAPETRLQESETQASADASSQPDVVVAIAAASLPCTSMPAVLEAPIERRHPLRFVWQMDDEGSFALGSDEFIDLIGPRTAAVLGRPWSEIAAALALDPEGQIARAVATHDTWSGLTVLWPLDHSPERLAVELSGLPVFDRERVFRGYRGFGVCRDLARLSVLARQRHTAAIGTPSAAVAEAPTPMPQVGAGEDILNGQPAFAPPSATLTTAPAAHDHLAPETEHANQLPGSQFAHEPTSSAEALPAAPHDGLHADAPPAQNILPFRATTAEANGPQLSPIEHSAFRELSRKLKQRLNGLEQGDRDIGMLPGQDDAAAAAPETSDTTSGLRPMLDRLGVGVLIYRFDQLLYANPAFLRGSGHQSLEALIAAGGLDELFIEPIGAAAVGDDKLLTLTIDRGDKINVKGELIGIQWEGEPAHALVTAAETGESAKLLLARAEIAELKSILDAATDGVLLLDARGLVLSANRSGEALLGHDNLVGRPLTELLAPESVDVAREYLEGFLRDGAANALNGGREVIGRARQGGAIPLFVTLGRIGGETGKLCAVVRDLTHQKKAEEELTQAKAQAERASASKSDFKSDFLAKVSHEIRTPLNVITGFAEVMLGERLGPIGNDRYRDYLEDIHASGGHLLSLINDLIDLSKIQAGKLELSFTSLALNNITQECVTIMQPQASRERILIRTSFPPTLPQVVADARSVRQIVLNLLSNSIKLTSAGGQVIVSTALNDDGEVVLRVRDTGIGMSEKDLVAALEPFRRIATSAPARSGGTGLGLPLTKALAEANRARFHIRSAPKDGTLVEIAFSATRVPAG
jgi:PAS domain S-box-containing protein